VKGLDTPASCDAFSDNVAITFRRDQPSGWPVPQRTTALFERHSSTAGDIGGSVSDSTGTLDLAARVTGRCSVLCKLPSGDVKDVSRSIFVAIPAAFAIEPEKRRFEIDVPLACVYADAPATLNPSWFVR
jgi:hypothetical protein